MSQKIENLEAELAFLASIEPAARKQLAEDLGELGQQALQAQQEAAPFRTGRLRNALTVAQAINGLRVRVGFPDFKGGRDSRFYAIMQEYGVRAGQALVQRRKRVNGKLRGGKRKRLSDIVATYVLTWRARAAHPFVHQEARFDQLLTSVQDRFWDEALNRVEP